MFDKWSRWDQHAPVRFEDLWHARRTFAIGVVVGIVLSMVATAQAVSRSHGDFTFAHALVGLGVGCVLGMSLGFVAAMHNRTKRLACAAARASVEARERRGQVQKQRSRVRTYVLIALTVSSMAAVAYPLAAVLRTAWGEHRTSAWPTTAATIQSIKSIPDDHGRAQSLVEYSYSVDGVVFEGEWFDAAHRTKTTADEAHVRETMYPVGSVHTASYDPNDPSQAVLMPAVSARTQKAIVTSGLMAVGFWFALWVGLCRVMRAGGIRPLTFRGSSGLAAA